MNCLSLSRTSGDANNNTTTASVVGHADGPSMNSFDTTSTNTVEANGGSIPPFSFSVGRSHKFCSSCMVDFIVRITLRMIRRT